MTCTWNDDLNIELSSPFIRCPLIQGFMKFNMKLYPTKNISHVLLLVYNFDLVNLTISRRHARNRVGPLSRTRVVLSCTHILYCNLCFTPIGMIITIMCCASFTWHSVFGLDFKLAVFRICSASYLRSLRK